VALLVSLSVIPLGRMVRQDFIPTDVDEGEFQISVTGPTTPACRRWTR
jgi:hypothetical protein